MFQRLASLLVFAAMAALVPLQAHAADPVEGLDYVLIDPPVATHSGEKIEVVEVFGYSCSHCANFAPLIKDWTQKQADDVKVEFVPAVFGGVWEVYARVYYTAQTMGVADSTHDELFDALHVERRPVSKIEDIAEFYAEHGVDQDQFLATLDSFPVNAKIAEARTRVTGYGVEGTPSMVVAGKYRVMAPREGGFKRMLEITDFLVSKERAARKASST